MLRLHVVVSPLTQSLSSSEQADAVVLSGLVGLRLSR